MHPQVLTVWINHPFPPDEMRLLEQLLPPHRLVTSPQPPPDNLNVGPSDPLAREADVIYGQPAVEDVLASPARLVGISSAGYTRYDSPEVRAALADRGAALVNASRVYAEPCAQHVAAMMLAISRDLPACVGDHARRRWEPRRIRQQSFLLRGQRVLLVGYGAIARRLAELLRPFGLDLRGVRRSPRGDEAIPCVTPGEMDALLPEADHVVNILPAGAGTERFFDDRRLGLLRPSAIYYSIGRGRTTDQQALIRLLLAGRLRAAYLDVFDPEPPHADDPVWRTPRLYMTPHSGGGFDAEHRSLAEHLVENVARFAAGGELLDRVF